MSSIFKRYLHLLGGNKNIGVLSDVINRLVVKEKKDLSEEKCTLEVNGVKFLMTWDADELTSIRSSENCFLLGKAQPMIDRYIAMDRELQIKKVFDLGILQGGSVVLYDRLFQTDKIVAIELLSQPVEALSKYIERNNKSDSIKPYYGINQADHRAMEMILSSEFPEKDIDLVVDDASHLYVETREAFNIGFPYLKAGGRYVIEDWGWAHWSGEPWQTAANPFGNREAMSNLIIELFMLTASRPDLIEDITVNHNLIIVKKGPGQIPDGRFEMGKHYLLRGKTFKPWL